MRCNTKPEGPEAKQSEVLAGLRCDAIRCDLRLGLRYCVSAGPVAIDQHAQAQQQALALASVGLSRGWVGRCNGDVMEESRGERSDDSKRGLQCVSDSKASKDWGLMDRSTGVEYVSLVDQVGADLLGSQDGADGFSGSGPSLRSRSWSWSLALELA